MQVGLPLVQALKAAAATNPGELKKPWSRWWLPAQPVTSLPRADQATLSSAEELSGLLEKGTLCKIVPTTARMRLY